MIERHYETAQLAKRLAVNPARYRRSARPRASGPLARHGRAASSEDRRESQVIAARSDTSGLRTCPLPMPSSSAETVFVLRREISKTVKGASSSRVQIPPPPLKTRLKTLWLAISRRISRLGSISDGSSADGRSLGQSCGDPTVARTIAHTP